MPASQVVFTGVPAFIGAIKGPTRVGFFIDENEFDPAKMIEIDLAKNPSTISEAAWATDVDCDHPTAGGLTTIGPRFHKDGAHRGLVYLAERVVNKYGSVLANWPPAPDELYQYQAVVRSTNGAKSRYHGFKVRVLSPAVGTLAHVALYRVGASAPPSGSASARWIDLADPAVCDPASHGFTKIAPSSPVGTEGALFLSTELVAADGPNYPKWPRNLGW